MAESDIAVIGMACRFPGADSPTAFWELLRDGREGSVEFSDEELRSAGVPDCSSPIRTTSGAECPSPGSPTSMRASSVSHHARRR